MLGTHFSRYPWIFNAGEMLTGFAALGAALGLCRFFRRKTNVLLSWLIGLSVACTGVMTLKAGMFPMPDPRHNSWDFLQNLTLITPHLMLIGLWKRSHSSGLRTYLIFSVTFLFLLGPLVSSIGRGTLQRLIAVGTLVPVGVIGFFFWRELHRKSLERPNSMSASWPFTRNRLLKFLEMPRSRNRRVGQIFISTKLILLCIAESPTNLDAIPTRDSLKYD